MYNNLWPQFYIPTLYAKMMPSVPQVTTMLSYLLHAIPLILPVCPVKVIPVGFYPV